MKKYLTGLFALLMLGSANATVIGFSSGTGTNTYTEGDYTFTAPGSQYVSSNYLDFHSHSYSQAPTVITSSVGLFDFLSFDFRQNGSHENLTISNNLGASMYFSYADYSSWNSIVLGSGWSDLTSVSFSSTYDVTLDNVNVVASSVPEPTSLALLGLGLAGFGFARKKTA